MALLNKLFLTKKKVCKDNLLKDTFRPLKITKEHIRLLLFKECDWRGRKLLFDSSTVEKISANSEAGRKILGKDKNASKTSKREANHIYEILDGFIYQYKNAAPDARLLGEMIFGAVAMNYCGISLKVHTLDEPQRLMCTKVFGVPVSRSSTTDKSATHSTEQMSRVTKESSDTNMSTRSMSTPSPRANLDDGFSLSLSFGRGDSGFYGDCSSNSSVSSSLEHGAMESWVKDDHTHDDLFYYQAYPCGRKLSSCSSGSVQRRMHRNASTRLDCASHNYLQVPLYGSATNNNYHSQIYNNSGSDTSDSLTSFGSAGSSGVQNKMKLGLALLITLTPDMEKDMLRLCTEHAPQLEALLYRLRAATERRPLAMSLLQATQDTAQWLTDVLYGPPLPPVWLSLVSGAEQLRRHQADLFMQDLCSVLATGDTKTTNFFMSNLITSVLTYHLGWVSTVSSDVRPRLDVLNHNLPYNPLWAQLTDLRGALGRPARAARTVLSGKDCAFLNKVLSVLTYFIRCGDIQQRNYQKTNFLHTVGWCDPTEASVSLNNSRNIIVDDCFTIKNNSDFNISDSRNKSSTNNLSVSNSSSGNLSNSYVSYINLNNCQSRKISENNSVYFNNLNKSGMNLIDSKSKFVSDNKLYVNMNSDINNSRSINKSCINLNESLDKVRLDQYSEKNSEYFDIRKNKSVSSCDSETCLKNNENTGLKRTSTFATELKNVNSDTLYSNLTNKRIVFPQPKLYPKDMLECQSAIPDTNRGDSKDAVCKGLTKKLSVINNCLLDTTLFNTESANLDDSEMYGAKYTNDSGVVFVLGDDEELVGLKNIPTSSRSSDNCSKSSQNVTKHKNNPNSILKVGTSSETSIFTDPDSDLSRESSPESIGDSDSVKSSKCCLSQKKPHSKPVKHSGVKFEFDKYPQIVTNYMKSKNLELLNRDYLGKPGNLKLDGFSFDPTVIPPLPEENESCPKCRLVGLTLQTPSNASELEFTSDMPCHSQVQYAKEQTVEDTSVRTCDTPKTFVRKRKENTVIVNVPYTICERTDARTELRVRKKSSIVTEQLQIDKEVEVVNQKLSTVKGTCSMEVTEIPMPKSSPHSPVSAQHKSGYSHTLLKGVSDHYVPDLILQGTLARPAEWENRLRQELKMSVHLDKVGDANSNTQAVAIVADVDQWAVRVWGSCGVSGVAGGLSVLVGNMLDTIPHMWHTKVPATQCLSYIESRLRDICLMSKNLADVLMTTDLCDMATLTRVLQLDANDVPLLLAVASTHTPQLASRYGISYK